MSGYLRCGATWLVVCWALAAGAERAWAEGEWPQWRGPRGDGQSGDRGLPVRWDQEDVAWRAELPGRGQSSPVIWGQRIFLTAAVDQGRGRVVLCLDRRDGKLLWQRQAWTGEPEKTHAMNPWASATCATDGQRVVAFFGRGGIHCYDFDGQRLWSRDLGDLPGPWGTAASPVIVADLVVQNCDAESGACLLALDKQTGQTVWRTSRENLRGWSTPLLVDTPGRRELVLNGEPGVHGYDPLSGQELWFCRGDTGRGTPTVVPAGELLVAVNGRAGDMLAVRPGGSGQVNGTHEAWRTRRRGGRDLPSPIVVGDYLVVLSMRPGIVSCYETSSGRELDRQRLDGNFVASPIAANGLVYATNEAGQTFVLRPGSQLELVARNQLDCRDDETFRASLAACGGQLFCRSDQVLYCIGKP